MPDSTQQTTLAELKKNLALFHNSKPSPEGLELQNEIRRLLMKYRHAGGTELGTFDFSNLNLSKLNLTNMDFSETTIHNTNFKNAILIHASFCGRDRRNLHVIDADFSGANCTATDFHCCDLRTAIFDENTKMEEMNIQKSKLTRQNFGIFIQHAKYTMTQPIKLKLTEISLEGENLSGMDLSGLYLHGVFFRKTNLLHTDFGNSDVSGAYFTDAKNFSINQLDGCANRNAIYYSPTPAQKKRDRAAKNTKPITDFFTRSRKRPASEAINEPNESPNKKSRNK